MKALGVGLGDVRAAPTSRWLRRRRRARRRWCCTARPPQLAAERGVDRWHLTLTHTDTRAQAIAVAL